MDVNMPVMNGYDATKAIRSLADQDKAGVTIVAMTANAFDEDRKAALQAGMNGHLAKPIDMERLKDMIVKIL
jgi:CheY-like chemotaxis protein